MMGHLLLHVLGGKEDNMRRSERFVGDGMDALGLLHLRHFFGGGFVLPCGTPHDFLHQVQCMTVRVIQPILHRNQTTR